MAESDVEKLGCLIQDYVQAVWGASPDVEGAERLGALLEPELKDRIDVLGFDSEKLLKAAAAGVLKELDRLENEAAREDSLVQSAASQARVLEVQEIGRKPNRKLSKRGDLKKNPARNRARARLRQPGG